MEECQPLLLIAPGLFKKLSAFGRCILPEQTLDAAVEFFNFFIEVLQKRRITNGEIFFLAVELVICDRLNPFRAAGVGRTASKSGSGG